VEQSEAHSIRAEKVRAKFAPLAFFDAIINAVKRLLGAIHSYHMTMPIQ
jgi:hypothetical protein